jgi:mono/diheme cytochrome c family protein
MSIFNRMAFGHLAKSRTLAPLLLLCGTASVLAQPISPLAKRGEALLARECSMCHAVEQYGESPQRPAPSFRTLARQGEPAQIREALEKGITSGHPAMPTFSLSGSEIEAILAYLREIRER